MRLSFNLFENQIEDAFGKTDTLQMSIVTMQNIVADQEKLMSEEIKSGLPQIL
ncbi:MAG: hypothetical protein ABI370_07585 [Gammaproteobacteria bacterium]